MGIDHKDKGILPSDESALLARSSDSPFARRDGLATEKLTELEVDEYRNELRRRDHLLKVVSNSIADLLTTESVRERLAHTVQQIAQVVNIDRMLVVESGTHTAANTAHIPYYVWFAPGAPPLVDWSAIVGEDDEQEALGNWISCVREGKVAFGSQRTAPPALRRFLARLNVISTMLVPIMIRGKHWGQIGFDDCNNEHDWTPEEINTLKLFADVIGAAITRERSVEDLLEANEDLVQGREMFRLMAESTQAVPFTLDLTRGCFPYIGAQGIADAGITEVQLKVPGSLDVLIPRESNPEVRQHFDECQCGPFEFVAMLSQRNQRRSEVRWTGTCEIVAGVKYMRGLMLDITEMRRLGRERAAAQKLESVGRLAAGVAHEINTPVQFVTDNVQFVRTSIADIDTVIQAYRGLQQAVQSGASVLDASRLAAEAEQVADLDYLLENVPLAIGSAIDGLDRIATIVRSMKEFAHPNQEQKSFADLNRAVQSTLVIANNEFKYVAELETQFGELPLVSCNLGEINQVVLNLIINASHAIADAVKGTATLGKLTVRTRLVDDEVEISIADTGTGIPEAARDKIFDPFFTTKEVGKGTGQGLALAHSVIVKKHGGTLRFETECGKGTTFLIRLPIDDASAAGAGLV